MFVVSWADRFPLPPEQLIRRAGVPDGADPIEHYVAVGLANKQALMSLDPARGWAEGRHILDFGCGAGRVLRQFADEADHGEVWGCDIDVASIEWLQRNLDPPFRFLRVAAEPTLPFAAEYFDLIYAISVFTHIADHWAAWLLALHRVLKAEGFLIVTFLGAGMIGVERGGRWDPDSIGMNVLRKGQAWAGGGPTVFHSDWWIRAHWGRAFEILENGFSILVQ